MLVQFSVKNFRTFKEKATLSFVASNYDKDTREEENVFVNEKFKLRLLKSAVVYGANASGKTMLLNALLAMQDFALYSWQIIGRENIISIEPFLLNTETINEPTEFEVILIFQTTMYRYGFEVTAEKVISEWLYYNPKGKEIELFYREEQNFNLHKRNFKIGQRLVKDQMIRDDTLLLTVAAQYNDHLAQEVQQALLNINPLIGSITDGNQGFTMDMLKDNKQRNKITELLKAADIGIEDISLLEATPKELVNLLPTEKRDEYEAQISELEQSGIELGEHATILTFRKGFNSKNEFKGNIALLMDSNESAGTKKFFGLIGPLLYVLENGCVLMIDELDAKLHPNLVSKIVSLFNSKEANPNNAQLIFNTHNTNLLDEGLFRRDQIWFTEKDKFGAAELFSLADFKSSEVRKGEPYENNYLRGKYGGVPHLNTFDTLNNIMFEQEMQQESA